MIDLTTLSTSIYEYVSLVSRGDYVKLDDDIITRYEELLAGAIAHRAGARGDSLEELANIQKVIPNINAIITWLRGTDFYSAPASTRYHESYRGGLLIHTLKAYNKMTELIETPSFSGVDVGSATLVILAHDWCKIDRYESYMKNVQNPKTEIWEKQLAYRCKEDCVGLGHGPQSLMMLSRFCTSSLTSLTFEEMAAIRWHMYTYDVTSYDIYDLTSCNKKFPLVLITQFADQMAVCEF